MSKKTIKRNTAKKRSGSNDITGILLILISVFCLICLIVTPVLSDIGVAVKNVLTGLFGYISYPLFLCMLIAGIAVLQNRSVALTGKQLTFIGVSLFILIIILQLATSTKYMTGNISEYISDVYSFSKNKTVGGLLFGIFAFALKTVATKVGAYILLAILLVIFSALLTFDLVNNISRKKEKQKPAQQQSQPASFSKGGPQPQPLTPVTDNSLFVGEIIPVDRSQNQIEGTFSSLDSYQQNEKISDYEDAGTYYTQNGTKESNQFSSYDSYESYQDPYTTKSETDAYKLLFGNDTTMFQTYSENIAANMGIKDYSVSTPASVQSAPYVKKEEPSPLGEVVMPPSKEFLNQYIEGDILNGDDLAKESQTRPQPQEAETISPESSDNDDVVFINGDNYIQQSAKTESSDDDDNFRQDIIADDDFVQGGEIINTDKIKPEIKSEPVYNFEDYFAAQTDHKYYNDTPIINDYNYKEVTQQLKEKEDKDNAQQEQAARENSKPVKAETVDRTNKFQSQDENLVREDSKPVKAETVDKTNKFQSQNENLTYEDAEESQDEILSVDIGEEEPFIYNDDNRLEDAGALNDADKDFAEASKESYTEENDFDGVYNTEEVIDQSVEDSLSDTSSTIDTDETESQFEKLLNEDNNIDESIRAEEEDSLPQQNTDNVEEQQSQSDSDNEDKSGEEKKFGESANGSYFRIIDEVEDKSENNGKVENDNTGYYTVKKQPINPNTIKNKNGALKDQIKIEDYMTTVAEQTVSSKPKRKHTAKYVAPPVDLLINTSTDPSQYGGDCETKAKILEEKLESLGYPAKVIEITKGPAATRYELEAPVGTSIKRISALTNDIAYALASNGKIRVEAPISGKSAIGVEVPNESIATVSLRELIESQEFKKANSPLTIALGKDITGHAVLCPLEKMPHLLIGGQTGSGKSVCLNSIIVSLLYKATPDEVKLLLIDPKRVEFTVFEEMPHLLIPHNINTAAQAVNALKWLREEMERRYSLCAKYKCRNIGEFNAGEYVKSGEEAKLPYIVVIFDEFGDFIIQSAYTKDIEENVTSLAQKARAAGIHLILATQRPVVKVITGTIKANLNSRIAFSVAQANDSQTILDQKGAEALLGKGDMLYSPVDASDPKRVQGAWVSISEIESVVNFIKENNEADFDESIEEAIMKEKEDPAATTDDAEDDGEIATDPLLKDVVKRVIETNRASASMIQSRFKVGYARAARIIDQMEALNFIGPSEGGTRPREIFISRELFKEFFGEDI